MKVIFVGAISYVFRPIFFVISLSLVFLISGCWASVNGVTKNARQIDIHMDESIWRPVTSIRWPSDGKRVRVFYSVDEIAGEYGLGESEIRRIRSDNGGIRMGRIRGDLVVYIGEHDLIRSEKLKIFVSIHESFHLAAQYYGMKIPLRNIEAKVDGGMENQVASLFSVIKFQSGRYMDENIPIECAPIEREFAILEKEVQEYAMERSFWEWPAEYYSRAIIAEMYGSAAYEEIRGGMLGGDALYMSGAYAMLAVEKSRINPNWQNKVALGVNPLKIFMENFGCHFHHRDGIAVEINNIEFLP